MTREDAYKLVQEHALAAFDGGAPLQERVARDPKVSGVMTKDEISDVFSLARHLKEVDRIVDRALA